MKSSKVCHKTVPQKPPTSVPRTNLLYTRGTKYYFRRRIPTDLVNAKAYGDVIEIRESLGTSDRREAERLAHFRALELLDEWARKRNELRVKGVRGFVRRSNEGVLRPLSSLTPLERRAFIHDLFIRLENAALEGGVRDPASLEDRVVTDLIETTKTDLAVMTSNSHFAPIDWDKRLAKALEEQDIEIDKKAATALPEMRQLIARAYVESAERTLRSLRGDWQASDDPYFKDLGIGSQAPELTKSVSLAKLASAYERHQQEVGIRPSTRAKTVQCIHIMKSLWGANTPVSSIGREHASQLVTFLKKLPRNASKRYPASLSLEKMSELEARKESPEWISAKTLQNQFITISGMLNFAVDHEWLTANPLSNRTLIKRLPEVERHAKAMMTPEEIALVINSDEFRSQRSSDSRGHARFWVPLICLFHGMRTNEASQLLVADSKEEDSIPYLSVRTADDQGRKVKSLKTKASSRRIPVHEEIIKIGFMDYVEQQRSAGEVWLFPALTENSLGSRSDAISKWFSRLRKELITDLPDQPVERQLKLPADDN